MTRGPLEDAIDSLKIILETYPELNGETYSFGTLELTFKNGVLYSVGPFPHLVRGKDFRVTKKVQLDNR